MNDSLRSKVIRLAHQQPHLRPHLLPLLTDTAVRVAARIPPVPDDGDTVKGAKSYTSILRALVNDNPGLKGEAKKRLEEAAFLFRNMKSVAKEYKTAISDLAQL